ncbi:PAS domain-containing response regulator [Methanoplanus endosymbiosus]|uniref:Response regulator n=1 Tax=Methanoplanus endosymbiosus TaxID=33865 RepID=A0A9E7THJ5_9EURY|nr:response regulator [Methanoplanus endosymbiosus]UUX93057.1 response regulator [Methanoplanus endosymbiosus]
MIRILLVDDQKYIILSLRKYFERDERFSVDSAYSVKEGLEKLNTGNYDAIISDYVMPGMNGIEFLKEVKSQYPDMLFYIFTGHGRDDIALEALENGADYYLEKGCMTSPTLKAFKNIILTGVSKNKAVNELKYSNRRFGEIIECLPEASFVIDENKCISAWNKNIELLSGISKPIVLGRSLYELLASENSVLNEILSLIPGHITDTECIINNPAGLSDVICEHKRLNFAYGGKGAEVIVRIAPLGEKCPYYAGSVITVTDVTEMKETINDLALLTEKYQFIFNNVNSAIFIHRWGDDSRPSDIIEVNDVAVSALGYSREELLSMVVGGLDEECCRYDLPEICENIEKYGEADFEMIHVSKDKKKLLCDVHARIYTNCGFRYVISVVNYRKVYSAEKGYER